jgi:hypothetical protein
MHRTKRWAAAGGGAVASNGGWQQYQNIVATTLSGAAQFYIVTARCSPRAGLFCAFTITQWINSCNGLFYKFQVSEYQTQTKLIPFIGNFILIALYM